MWPGAATKELTCGELVTGKTSVEAGGGPLRRGWLSAAIAAATLIGCQAEVASDLDERSATRIVLTLDDEQIAAHHEPDPIREGRFQVSVARGDVGAALSVLAAAGLPEEPSPGVLQALGEPGMVPTQASERARWLVGLAGELEKTLQELDGVQSARVHLALPEKRALGQSAATPPSASVLLRHRGASPPLSEVDVRQLVAGAVSGLAPADVSVVMHAVTSPPHRRDGERMATLGPFAVAHSSLSPLRLVLIAAAALNVVLVVLLGVLWSRSRMEPQRLTPSKAPPS